MIWKLCQTELKLLLYEIFLLFLNLGKSENCSCILLVIHMTEETFLKFMDGHYRRSLQGRHLNMTSTCMIIGPFTSHDRLQKRLPNNSSKEGDNQKSPDYLRLLLCCRRFSNKQPKFSNTFFLSVYIDDTRIDKNNRQVGMISQLLYSFTWGKTTEGHPHGPHRQTSVAAVKSHVLYG